MNEATALLTARNLAIGYRNNRRSSQAVLRDLCLEVHAGELICLLGANGSGKTTLLRTLAGLNSPISGELLLQGKALSHYTPRELAQYRGIVLTERVGGAMLTACDIVTLGRHPYTDWRGQLSNHDHEIVSAVMRLVGVELLASRYFDQLSDGEKQKILIARALAQEPHFLLLDEPTAFLDLPRRVEIALLLKQLTRQTGCAILLATHDLDSALRVADRFWLIGEDGKMRMDIPENIVLNGHLEKAFLDTDLQFNYQSGAFERPAFPSPAIYVQGAGAHHEWTCRALRRLGYGVETTEPNSLIPTVTITHHSFPPVWRWQFRGENSEYTNLPQFLAMIQDKYSAASET